MNTSTPRPDLHLGQFDGLYRLLNAPARHWQAIAWSFVFAVIFGGPFAMAGGFTPAPATAIDSNVPPSGTYTVTGSITASGATADITAGRKFDAATGGASGGVALSTTHSYLGTSPAGNFPGIQNDGSNNLSFYAGGGVLGQKMSTTGLQTTYGGVATAGQGLSPIRAYGSLLATSTGSATIATYTAPADGVYALNWSVNVTAWTSSTVGVTATWTDVNNTAHTAFALMGENASGSAAITVSATGIFNGFQEMINAKSGTAITLKTTFGGTATADFFGSISQIN